MKFGKYLLLYLCYAINIKYAWTENNRMIRMSFESPNILFHLQKTLIHIYICHRHYSKWYKTWFTMMPWFHTSNNSNSWFLQLYNPFNSRQLIVKLCRTKIEKIWQGNQDYYLYGYQEFVQCYIINWLIPFVRYKHIFRFVFI